jgi:hypothetical protein
MCLTACAPPGPAAARDHVRCRAQGQNRGPRAAQMQPRPDESRACRRGPRRLGGGLPMGWGRGQSADHTASAETEAIKREREKTAAHPRHAAGDDRGGARDREGAVSAGTLSRRQVRQCITTRHTHTNYTCIQTNLHTCTNTHTRTHRRTHAHTREKKNKNARGKRGLGAAGAGRPALFFRVHDGKLRVGRLAVADGPQPQERHHEHQLLAYSARHVFGGQHQAIAG